VSDLPYLVGQEGKTLDQGSQYKLLQWFNNQSAPNAKSNPDTVQGTGGFLAKLDSVGPDFPMGRLVEHYFSDANSEDVYSIGSAEIAILAMQTSFFVKQGDKDVYLDGYVPGARGRNRFLVFMRGCEDWHVDNGPLMLTATGTTGLAIRKDILGEWRSKVHKAIERASGKGVTLSLFSFFIPILPGPITRVGSGAEL
jgi:hypothetical protein